MPSKSLNSKAADSFPYKVVHFKSVVNWTGFACHKAKPNTIVKLLVKATINSDDPEFSGYIEQISNQFLHPNNINPDYITHFVMLMHADGSGDLYYGILPITIEARAKNNLKKGQLTLLSDIADVRRMKFGDIKIDKSDKIIVLFKVGWKFGLHFDFARPDPLDIDGLYLALGSKYKELLFHHFFNLVDSGSLLSKMGHDGWFPFIDLVPDNLLKLKDGYEKGLKREKIQELLDAYDEKQIKRMTDRWWSLDIMKTKKPIIEAGVNAYLAGGKQNYITSIKTLISEVEGVIKLGLVGKTNLHKDAGIQELITHISKKEIEFSGSTNSLLSPNQFLSYLNEELFKHFSFGGSPELSRHSVTHGAAEARKYTRVRALQVILTIDHLCFMIKSALVENDDA